jgi:hypothetical protein
VLRQVSRKTAGNDAFTADRSVIFPVKGVLFGTVARNEAVKASTVRESTMRALRKA